MRCQVINLVSHTNAINLYDISHTFPCRGQGGSDVASMPSPVNHDLLFRRASKPHGVIVPTVEWHQVQASQSRAPYTTESYTHNERQACMGFEHVTLGPRGASQAFFDGSIVPAGWVQARDAHHYSCPSVMPLDGPWVTDADHLCPIFSNRHRHALGHCRQRLCTRTCSLVNCTLTD
jgi:hypothetical protein